MAISKDPHDPLETELDKDTRERFELSPVPGTTCYYCGEEVSHPAIYWAGMSDWRLWLHPKCVLGLTGGLLIDVGNMMTWYDIQRTAKR